MSFHKHPAAKNMRVLALVLVCVIFSIAPSYAQSFVDLRDKTEHKDDVSVGKISGASLLRGIKFAVEDFNSVLSSEIDEHFGTRHLASTEYSEMWFNAIDYEWRRLKEQRRLNGGSSDGLSPYLVCDIDYGKLGAECHELVKEHFGEDLVTVYNDYDKSCYVASATAVVAQSVPSSLVVTPLIPEGKIRKGVIDDIEFTEPMPSSFHALFCPGVTYDFSEAEDIAQSIIASLYDEADSRRFLLSDNEKAHRLHVSHAFLRTDADVKTRHEERQEFWERTLQAGIESGACKDMFNLLEIEVSDLSAGFTVSLPPEDQGWGIRECLHSLVAGLSVSDDICSIESRREIETLNAHAQWVTQSNVRDSKPFFDVGLSGEGQVVQVSDTGIDPDSCYFSDNTNGAIVRDGRTDLGKRKVVQYVPFADSIDANRGHGTHVAGSVAGKREGTDGSADGMAPNAKIAFFDIGYSGSSGLSGLRVPNNPSMLFKPGQEATAKIHSASWGSRGHGTYGFGERLYDSFMASNDDFLFIVAAGNHGEKGEGSVGSPATCKNGISVGATQNAAPHITDRMLGQNYLASFSSAGPTFDQRAKPDILAPGMYIGSVRAWSDHIGECDDTDVDVRLYKAGTSMAAPIVSGTAALIRQYFEQAWYPGGSPGSGVVMNPSSALVKAVLINGAQAIDGIQSRNGTTKASTEYDNYQQFGRINLITSLPLSEKNNINALVVDRESISNNQEDTYHITITSSGGCQEPLSASLVWTDPPGSSGCTKCLINNLDLTIDGPDGTVYPNGRTSADTVNNAERIRIDNADNNDAFIVRVRGANLDTSSQAYSLVVTGCFVNADSSPTPPVSSVDPTTSSPVPTPPPSVSNVAQPISTPVPTPSPSVSNVDPTTSAPVPVVYPSTCVDGNNGIFVDDVVGNQDCTWLVDNKDDFPWLCFFRDISLECPETCGVCDVLVQAPEEVGDAQDFGIFPNGETAWQGNMLNMEILNDVSIFGMYVHIRVNAVRRVQVYMKDGSYAGSEFDSSAWGSPLIDVEVQGQGYGKLTTIGPDVFGSLWLKAGDTKAFYITLTGGFQDLVMLEGCTLNAVLVESEDLLIRWGNTITYPFGGASNQEFSSYAINGGFLYAASQGGGCSDSSDAFFVDNRVGEQTCDWVAANILRFDYLCNFVEFAAKCPSTCEFCFVLGG